MWWVKKKKSKKLGRPTLLEQSSPTFQRKKIKKELDRVFSIYIRHRDGWSCVVCKKEFEVGNKWLTNSHYFGRGEDGTRWDEENCDSFCLACHQKIENNKKEDVKINGEFFNYERYKKSQLGQDRFDFLEYKYRSITKYSVFDLEQLVEIYKGKIQGIMGES